MPGNALAKVDELYQNREQRAKDLRSQGKKVIGYFCCFPPVEFITALDMVPYRIMGSVEEPITQADTYLETIMCPFIRSAFDLGLKGRYDFFDGLVVPHSCDVVQRIYDIWRYHCNVDYTHFINVPHMLQPSSYEFFREELSLFKRSLEKFAGHEISDQRLRQAIQLHNENRSLLRELYELRKPDPPLISGTEVAKLLIVVMSIPVREANELLQSVITEVRNRGNGPRQKHTRVLIYGCEIDDIAFVQLVEECGANVVIDDLSVGTRYFWDDVEETDGLLDGLAVRYLEKIRCPRTYRERTGTHQDDIAKRFSYLRDFAKDFNVNTVILYIIRFCDTHELDVPDVRDYLQEIGLPVLHLEDDYSVTTIGQLRTRIEAFMEMID